MSTYVIGDIQGCYDPFLRLLEKISFNPDQDTLWLTGDLVNRGPHSLETLRLIKSLGSSVITVLGNHDITLLALASGKLHAPHLHHTLHSILTAPDCQELIQWLTQQPLLHYDEKTQWLLVHAGLDPSWDLETALILSREAELFLRSNNNEILYENLFDLNITKWDPALHGLSRWKFIIHCLTRIRFCTPEGILDFTSKGSLENANSHLIPWFTLFHQNQPSVKILFGHWAALHGKTGLHAVIALDTGCVWGRSLTALRLEDLQYFSIECSKN